MDSSFQERWLEPEYSQHLQLTEESNYSHTCSGRPSSAFDVRTLPRSDPHGLTAVDLRGIFSLRNGPRFHVCLEGQARQPARTPWSPWSLGHCLRTTAAIKSTFTFFQQGWTRPCILREKHSPVQVMFSTVSGHHHNGLGRKGAMKHCFAHLSRFLLHLCS